jgi:hypothetical protein
MTRDFIMVVLSAKPAVRRVEKPEAAERTFSPRE